MLKFRTKINLINQLCRNLSSSTVNQVIPEKFIQKIKYRTCVGLYDRLRNEQPKYFKNSSSNGYDIEIEYVDNYCHKLTDDNCKTIVAIHGTADTYRTFTKLFNHFNNNRNDVRIIIPNSPDFSHTRKTNFQFWNTQDEKFYCLKDFLLKLNIKRIDCLIGNSYGSHLCMMLWYDSFIKNIGIEIKSMGFYAPQFHIEYIDEKYMLIGKILLSMSKSNFLVNLLKKINFNLKPYKFQDIDMNFLMCCYIVNYPDRIVSESIERVKRFEKNPLPSFIQFGNDERLITKSTIDKLYQLLNIDNHIIIDNDQLNFNFNFNYKNSKIIKSFILKDAGHFPHARYENLSYYLVEKLLFN